MASKELVDVNATYARDAEKYMKEAVTGGGKMLRINGGVLTIDDEPLPGNKACVVILDFVHENTFYDEEYDPDAEPMPPKCYAFARGDELEEMAPHDAMDAHEYFEKQNETCAGCPQNIFGTARKGRGKACQNRRRIALLPSGFYEKVKGSRDKFECNYIEDERHYASADIAYMKLPVTSAKELARYVNLVGREHSRPPYGVMTEITVVPDAKKQFVVQFEMLDLIPDELAPHIIARNQEAIDNIVQPYGPPEEKPANPQRTGRR